MERREFVAVAGGALVSSRIGGWADRRIERDAHYPPNRLTAYPAQEPPLSPEVFSRRLARAQAELATRRLDFLIATPSTNYEYLTAYNPGRSERLIALVLPAGGVPLVVCPSFEVERIKRHSTIAVEPSTGYETYLRLAASLGGGWQFVDGAPVTERLRIIKAAEEVALIRRAIEITEGAIAATFGQLAGGMTERDVARLLSREMQQRGAEGGGLVQFGPASALPHGGPAAAPLERETVVLIDCGCRVSGYDSDITRMTWFGDHPSDEFRKVFDVVHDAQTAAMQLGRPRVTQCQEMDRAARKVIADAGYGPFFTHCLGHGLGMDGHEVPYLVEGNATRLEPGMVFTIEPGIYQLGKFGVRIEDDCLMTENGVEVLSHRAAKL